MLWITLLIAISVGVAHWLYVTWDTKFDKPDTLSVTLEAPPEATPEEREG